MEHAQDAAPEEVHQPPAADPRAAAKPAGPAPAGTPAGGEPPAPPAGRSSGGLAGGRSTTTSLLTWGTVALVLLIAVVLVAIKLTGSGGTGTTTTPPVPQLAPAAVVQQVTQIPAAVYDTVGVSSSVAAVSAPAVLHGQAPLTRDGKPEILYIGNEFCPYCAAERWALVAALSRFGKFSALPGSQSGTKEVFASTPTFSFHGARYSSRFVETVLVETYTNQPDPAGTGYRRLKRLTATQRSLLDRYGRATGAAPLVPFVDVAGKAVVAGGSFSPSILQQLSMTQVAGGLSDPRDPATQAIVAAANYLTAAICDADGGRPGAVCTSKGVLIAQAAMQAAA